MRWRDVRPGDMLIWTCNGETDAWLVISTTAGKHPDAPYEYSSVVLLMLVIWSASSRMDKFETFYRTGHDKLRPAWELCRCTNA